MSNKLTELGVKKGDRIGIILPDSPQFNVAYWASLAAGAVIVNLNPLYTVEELTHYCKDTGLTGLFTFDTVLPKIKPLCQALTIPLVIVTRLTDFIDGKGVSTPEERKRILKWWYKAPWQDHKIGECTHKEGLGRIGLALSADTCCRCSSKKTAARPIRTNKSSFLACSA